ncbi:hypothetical protein Smic_24650 [Streptomyces microflavus]|uniref:Uncharacterized protein n=1 Tax=Streptomyces microflavus TaxID=1919 RepID=A0A7J0CNA2_STRMI|nr:hypothetical protein Smic_24650 [Streptomyces microflavus]
MAEVLGVEDGAFAQEEVLALGEELVVGGDHARAEAAVGEVDEFGEGEVARLAVVGVRVAAAVGRGVIGVGIGVGVLECGLARVEGHALTFAPPDSSGPSKVFADTVQLS